MQWHLPGRLGRRLQRFPRMGRRARLRLGQPAAGARSRGNDRAVPGPIRTVCPSPPRGIDRLRETAWRPCWISRRIETGYRRSAGAVRTCAYPIRYGTGQGTMGEHDRRRYLTSAILRGPAVLRQTSVNPTLYSVPAFWQSRYAVVATLQREVDGVQLTHNGIAVFHIGIKACGGDTLDHRRAGGRGQRGTGTGAGAAALLQDRASGRGRAGAAWFLPGLALSCRPSWELESLLFYLPWVRAKWLHPRLATALFATLPTRFAPFVQPHEESNSILPWNTGVWWGFLFYYGCMPFHWATQGSQRGVRLPDWNTRLRLRGRFSLPRWQKKGCGSRTTRVSAPPAGAAKKSPSLTRPPTA